MAARLWLLLLTVNGLFAVIGSRLLAALCHFPGWAYGASVVAVFFLTPWMLIAVSVVLAARTGRHAFSVFELRATLHECAYCTLVVVQLIVEPWRRSPDIDAPVGAPVRPLLLLHGIVCNRGVWRGWLRELRAAGFAPIRSINLEPLSADIDTHAAHVARELQALQRESRGARIDVIAHSMGGLIARAALPLGGWQTIRRIVTLACPHHGTELARHYPSAPTRQMRPDSSWLAALNGAQEEHWPVPMTSIFSLEDNLVVPARSSWLAGAHCHLLRGVGHLGLLGSRTARRCALAALRVE